MSSAVSDPEPMIVRVPRQRFEAPRICCCCGADADHNETIERTKRIFIGIGTIRRTVSLPVPCCARCGTNVRWHAREGMFGFIGRTLLLGFLMLMLASAIGGAISGLAGFGDTAARVTVIAFDVAIVGFWLWRRYRKQRPLMLDGHLCSSGSPVAMKTFDADTTTLVFRNLTFGKLFAAINERSEPVAQPVVAS